MSQRRPQLLSSLRARILSIVILGAILPLGLIGWWLSRSAATSAEQRLREQLDSSLVGAATAMDARWVFRDADLQLLASNDVVIRMLGRNAQALAATDSAFMSSLESELRPTISSVVYHDLNGAVRWTFGTMSPQRELSPGSPRVEPYSEPSVVVTRSILNHAGAKVGDMTASLRLSALLPVDSIPHVIAGSALRVYDGLTKEPIGSGPTDIARTTDRWISVRRTLTNVPLDVELAAPASAYLEPFERAARLGLLLLAIVTLLAIALSAVLATRLTRSLSQLVDSADAVARGDLTRSVEVTGGTAEIANLAASFNAMTDSLRSTLDKLSQRESLAAVGEFAASLSHEVRNALTAVAVDVQRAEERIHDPDKSRDLLLRALRNIRRLDSVVTGALRVARSGRVPRERVDLLDVIRTAVELAEPAMSGTTGTSIDFAGISDGSLAVIGDRIALEQLFLNVLVNAGQAIASAGKVNIALTDTAQSAVVTIQDNGRGISERDLARLGEPFYSARSDGTGLGVSIARRIATAHGGDLTIASTAGAGTTVTVTLPRVSAPPRVVP